MAIPKFIMRGLHSPTRQFGYWDTDEVYDDVGNFYVGPPPFIELSGVVLIHVIPASEIGLEILFELTTDVNLLTSEMTEFTQEQRLGRDEVVLDNPPPSVGTFNLNQDTSEDPVFNNRMAVPLAVDSSCIEYLGAPKYNLHELTLVASPFAGRVDQKLLASAIGGATVVAPSGNVRQILNDTNQSDSLQQAGADPPTFEPLVAGEGNAIQFDSSGVTNTWYDIPASNGLFTAPTGTARFSLSFGFQAITSPFAGNAFFIDTGVGTGRGFVLWYECCAWSALFSWGELDA